MTKLKIRFILNYLGLRQLYNIKIIKSVNLTLKLKQQNKNNSSSPEMSFWLTKKPGNNTGLINQTNQTKPIITKL